MQKLIEQAKDDIAAAQRSMSTLTAAIADETQKLRVQANEAKIATDHLEKAQLNVRTIEEGEASRRKG